MNTVVDFIEAMGDLSKAEIAYQAVAATCKEDIEDFCWREIIHLEHCKEEAERLFRKAVREALSEPF